jgi:two-component system NtrC family sensor kinase
MTFVLKRIQKGDWPGSDSAGNNGIRISVTTKLVLSFLLFIVITSAIFTGVGIYIISDHIKADGQEQAREDLDNARDIYLNKLSQINSAVRSTADRSNIRDAVASGNVDQVADELVAIKVLEALDTLTITDDSGNVLFRTSNQKIFGDNISHEGLISTVLRTNMSAAATEIIAAKDLNRESALLAEKASVRFTGSPESRKGEDVDGMMLSAAAPIFDSENTLIGLVRGGVLLHSGSDIICEIRRAIFHNPRYEGKDIGFVTIYQDDVGLLSCLRSEDISVVIGAHLPDEIYSQVVEEGKPYIGRDSVSNNWYITAYEPIRNIDREIIGVLQVGELEEKYLDIKNQAVIAFLTITLIGAFFTILFSYFISRRITTPLNKLVTASRELALGNLDARVDIKSMSKDELGELADAFNAMASALQERDEKLKEMTRSRVRRSERLAMIGKLSANVAHELNNPLTGIVTYSHLLLERMPAEHQDIDYVDKIVIQANRCRDIIRGLLDFARQREPNKTLCDVNSVLQECMSLLENQALFHNIQITKELDPKLPSAVIDPSQIERVFMNMIINAAEAMEGSGNLTLATRSDPIGGIIEIVIADTGHGIAEEDMRRIFDPFFTTKEVGQGTGLGLAISYGIVKEHGGSILVESAVGKGTTFTIKLPVTITQDLRANLSVQENADELVSINNS